MNLNPSQGGSLLIYFTLHPLSDSFLIRLSCFFRLLLESIAIIFHSFVTSFGFLYEPPPISRLYHIIEREVFLSIDKIS